MEAESEQGGASQKAVDLFVAAAIMALAALVMYDSQRLGAKWASDGPQAGYFPFYVGLIMFVSAGATFLLALRPKASDRIFVDRQQFRSVLAIFVPSAVYIALIYLLGIYIASAIFLAFFMRVHGGYGPAMIAPVALGMPVFLFVLFEMWFLVPLPKGPVESLLGF
ncbi:MAG: tripartite tricarboxylate transporter TctB family protein [Alphaproteobacteria bacterium]|nr:tripartite tricarboxylate transporter TctB family protein [Alphaproteobacteria bacterium]MBM3733681.1 tripartite tricarboxylate transporter TctB family protein [Acidimicrobiia bacterium]MBM3950530.1 tripartite tricarboxylate transporter TctB family protein [Rhodospirillales bacterium]